jgi:hypothetical protein
MTVTIRVPASGPTIRRPQGDPGSIDAVARALYVAAGRYEEFGDLAAAAKAVPGWYGDAYVAYASAASRASGEHATMAATVKRVAHVCSGHSDTLTDLLHDCDALEDTKVWLDGSRDNLIADVDAARDATPEEAAALQDRAQSLRTGYRSLVLDHEALQRKVRANEDLMRAAFEGAVALERILGPGGTADPLASGAMGRPGAPGHGASPVQVAEWWSTLTAAEKEAVVATYPDVIGCADGLPADARDPANRITLAGDLELLAGKEDDGTISTLEARTLANARAAGTALDRADGYVDPTTGETPGGQLWLYDPGAFDGDGRIAVAVGDLDTADDVAVRVPGITNDGQDAPTLTQEAINVYQSATYRGDGSTIASMMWLGYDAPDAFYDTATLTEGRAEDGGERFADAIDGLRASRPYDAAHLTAIGHSYGSTTVAHAATDPHVAVDDVVLDGSPGAGGGVDHAGELGVGADHVWVGRNSEDLVAALGDHGWVGAHTLGGAGLGNDPSEDDFGAHRFEAEDVTRSGWHRGTGQHGNYFNVDTESLYNIGRVVDGHGGDVRLADHTYDPWYEGPQDPEQDRTPTSDEAGRSDTVGGRP